MAIIEHMFRILRAIRAHLAAVAKGFDPDRLTVAQAAETIKVLAAIEKSAAGLRLLLARRVDNESLWGEGGERSAAEWLGKATGQSASDAQKDLECSRRLKELPAAEDAVRNGELSPDQAKAVADGASADPGCEDELLDAARRGSFGELARKAKARKAAALGDDEARHAAAHKNRSFKTGTNAQGEGWGSYHGPAHHNAKLNALLNPHLEKVFARARTEGRRERFDANLYDALMSLLGIDGVDGAKGNGTTAADTDRGHPTSRPGPAAPVRPVGPTSPVGPAGAPAASPPQPPAPVKAQLIMRVDAAALKRGHTLAGELCEIQGVGPVPVAALREFLPDAAIALVIQDGVDVFNVTNFSRRANTLQQIVLHLLNIGCTRLGCAATEHLEVDHRVDWHKIHVTELQNLDWLCAHDHRLKTHKGWQLEPGTGKRAMHPPGQQAWPDDPPGDPPDHAAA